jgi:DNA-directed RNA polymerase subunit N (RpoN/RPB10)
MSDERLIVYVCFECGKLIGTRENYYLARVKIDGEFRSVAICEGCHDKMIADSRGHE